MAARGVAGGGEFVTEQLVREVGKLEERRFDLIDSEFISLGHVRAELIDLLGEAAGLDGTRKFLINVAGEKGKTIHCITACVYLPIESTSSYLGT